MDQLTPVDAAFVILGLVVATTLLARHFKAPAPVIFAAVGMAAGVAWHLLPALPPIRIAPDMVLLAFLPPLLTVAAYALPLAAFRRNLLPIGLLAVGLVLATMLVVAMIAHAMAALPWAAALVLGAIVAPPDPVAATAIAGKTGLPHRLVVILEGEGLVNDAIAIVAYSIALKAAVSGTFDWTGALLTVLASAPAGALVGLALGWGTKLLRGRADSVPLEVAISVITPYLAYHLADRIGASGVIAVVTLGFMLRYYSTGISSPAARLAARTVWGAVRFASTGLVFLLLGLLAGEILAARPAMNLLGAAAAVTGGVIALRLLWMYLVPMLVQVLRLPGAPDTTWGERTILGWAGMRGIVSLALALALPFGMGGSGQLRTTIIMITFAVIFSTLILQGIALLPLMRRLGVGDAEREQRDEQRARKLARRAGLASIRCSWREGDIDEALYRQLARELDEGRIGIARQGLGSARPQERAPLLRAVQAQRNAIERLREDSRLGESLAEQLATELDIDAMSVGGEDGRLTGAGRE